MSYILGMLKAHGKASAPCLSLLRSCCVATQGEEGAIERTLRQSFLVSADMAHALHPNYTDKHDSLLAPAFQGGLVLKHNNNQRYATNAISAALFRCGCAQQDHSPPL